MSGAAFRLGTRLGRYPLLRWTIAALEQLVRMARLCVIVLTFVAAVTLAAYLITQFNYAPLWFRVYDRCVDTQPEAASFTEAIRHRSQCMNLASAVTREQMQGNR
jgi:hypothetical protein